MYKRVIAASAVLALGPLAAAVRASVSIEQIEAYETPSTTAYAPINFNGSPTYAGSSNFTNITFHAIDTTKLNLTQSTHAEIVADNMFGVGKAGHPYVTDAYEEPYDSFLDDVVETQDDIGVGPAPGNFESGVRVVNTSYVADYGSLSPDLDAIRRMDFMVNQDDVTFVVGAAGGNNFSTGVLNWSCFNSLAVSGTQAFAPTGGPGKQHADIYVYDEASFGAGTVSGYAAALYGNAQTANQGDAQHSYVVRSLLMAGTDKPGLSHQASNSSTGALDPYYGAGDADFGRSLEILESGEKTFATVASNIAVGTLYTTQQGWATSNISAGHQSVILFNSSNAITGLTASLNWNVTTTATTIGGVSTINTSNASLIFPNLTLEVRPVVSIAGIYEIGASLGNYTLVSNVVNDNVQYLWSNVGLAAGDYAFVITGDPTKNATVGLSYSLTGSFASSWNDVAGSSWGTASNWTNGVPNGQGAQANFLSLPGLLFAGTITLDGDRTVGQITFNNSNGYTIANGSGGTLIIDDTGDSSGTANPQINVLSGSHTISATVNLSNGVTTTIAAGSALNISGTIIGNGTLVKAGAGTLALSNSDSYGSTLINAGTVILASPMTGIFTRTQTININTGGTAILAAANSPGNRQLLISSGLSIAGSTNNWTGKLDLNNNDLDVPGGNLATITNQLQAGFKNGAWNGSSGIVSSSAASNTSQLTTLGVIQNNQSGTAIFTASNAFDGDTAVGAADILVKYTYYGDANLDGKVDASDYSLIDSGYVTHATGWFNGDFNYDGVINGSDYTLIDNAFNTQGAQLSATIASPSAVSTSQIAETAAVPEPAAIGMIAIAGIAVLGRRRRLN